MSYQDGGLDPAPRSGIIACMDFARFPPAGYELQSRDSTFWAEELQFEHWRGLDIEGKLRLLEDWNAAVHEFQLEGLKRDHPGASRAELDRLAAEARYGREFVAQFESYRSPVLAER